ncbi:MAG: UvrD-helicase domain-containing protein [Bacteroidota bacterium]|nr:UvrD-helicase domain-containing protein [Bacteroidota bacterium]
MEKYLEDLNKEQRRAVIHKDGPLMVIAGAGSGKTRVLTHRIIHLLKEGVNPFNILSLTFTNKAAKEMRNRIENIIGNSISKNLWMGTFHSVFSRILRFESEKINYPRNFTIYDTEDSKQLIKSIIKELNLDKDIYKTGLIRNRISTLKNNFITYQKYNENKELALQDQIAKRIEFGTIYQTYQIRCHKASAMDFDDLLIKTYELLELFPELLEKYQQKFKYILIDEYQDTNHIQYLIVKKLASKFMNICVVGDDAQSIYSFRGANIQNILNFKNDYPNYTSYKLEQNYRSSSTIVEAANSIIKNNEKQIQKTVWTDNPKGEKIIVVKTTSDNDEGRLVANTISEIQMRKQVHCHDFAILYRTNAQSRALEESLRKKNIGYKIYGGLSFYQRKEIKDLLAYFRLAINPNDEEALKRIINYPRRGIGLTTLQTLSLLANSNNSSIWEVINNLDNNSKINKGTQKKLKDFALTVKEFIIKSKEKDAYFASEEIAKQSGVFNELYNDKSPEGVSRFENIQELLNGIKNFVENAEKESNKLADFMQDVALLTDQDTEKDNDFNKVTMMTVHAAKGLEFPYVFVVGLEENMFPNIMSSESQEALEEERRLFYVAITRAEKRLFLSFASTRFKWGQFIDSEKSRFIDEIDEKYLEKHEHFPSSEPKKSTKFLINKNQLNSNKFDLNLNKRRLKKVNYFAKNDCSDIEKIKNGMNVKHSSFGIGKIINISGEGANKKATVFFSGVGQKNMLLKFAKLEIVK